MICDAAQENESQISPQISDASIEHVSHLISVTRFVEKRHKYDFISVTRLGITCHIPYQ
jgi:hypothetical protein